MILTLKDPSGAVEKRFSCRSYRPESLTGADRKSLLNSLTALNHHPSPLPVKAKSVPSIQLYPPDSQNPDLSALRFFKNASSFLYAPVPHETGIEITYGYQMEMAVLRATEIGIASCWLGYFNSARLSFLVPPGRFIPSLVVLGYPRQHKTVREQVIRRVIRAEDRHGWDRLFFTGDFSSPLPFDPDHPLKTPLSFVRKSPSSGNTQPWRLLISRDLGEVHFYKKAANRAYELKKLHHIDLGIALCHFHLGTLFAGLQGRWIRSLTRGSAPPSNLEYIMTWQKISRMV